MKRSKINLVIILSLIICLLLFFLFYRKERKTNLQIKLIDDSVNMSFWEKNQCARGIPESIIKKELVLDHSFFVDEEIGVGVEDFKLDDNVHFIINQYGCEYFVIEIPIILDTNSFLNKDILDIYNISLDSLKKVINVSDINFLDDFAILLSDYINNNESISYEKLLFLEQNDNYKISKTIILKEPIIQEDSVTINMIYSIGPL